LNLSPKQLAETEGEREAGLGFVAETEDERQARLRREETGASPLFGEASIPFLLETQSLASV